MLHQTRASRTFSGTRRPPSFLSIGYSNSGISSYAQILAGVLAQHVDELPPDRVANRLGHARHPKRLLASTSGQTTRSQHRDPFGRLVLGVSSRSTATRRSHRPPPSCKPRSPSRPTTSSRATRSSRYRRRARPYRSLRRIRREVRVDLRRLVIAMPV